MAGFTKAISKSISWTLQVPLSWGLGQVEIHLSLFVSVLLCSLGLVASATLIPDQPQLADLNYAAVTLPIIWIVSLLVRLAVQILAIGIHGNDLETVVGPTGNLSTDYERLEGPVLLTYSVAGQAATLLLALLGFTVHAAISHPSTSIAEAFNFHGGWDSRGWASQILWVNLFLFVLHLLPSAPFDMRAFAFGWWKIANRKLAISGAYRGLGNLNSHLASILVGIGMTILALDFFTPRQLAGGALVFVPAAYLYLVSRWEHSLASDIDDLNQLDRQLGAALFDSSSQLEPSNAKARSVQAAHAGIDPVDEFGKFVEQPKRDESLDVDNILRKLYRHGDASLTASEREALLTASRQIKAKRNSESRNRPS